MPDEKDAVVTPEESVMIVNEIFGVPEERAKLPKLVRIAESGLRIAQIVGMSLVIILMLLTVAHVIGRYIFNYPMLGVVEVSSLMVVTLVFLSGPYDFLIDRHIGVDVIVRRLSPKAAAVVNSFTHILALAVMALAAVWTIKQGLKMTTSGAHTSQLHIPEYPFYFVVAFGWTALGDLCDHAALSLHR